MKKIKEIDGYVIKECRLDEIPLKILDPSIRKYVLYTPSGLCMKYKTYEEIEEFLISKKVIITEIY